MDRSTKTPQPPYYAVIFTSERTDGDKGYSKMSEKMLELAFQQPGFLGVESARDIELGITVSYWDSLDAIRSWKENSPHQIAQEKGKEVWYKNYKVKICKVEREYSFKME
ncbi:antibiotic biosynthesis monooxygenase family protein [Robertmurraya kyonggiensis]|uniref:Antibiotic biosynthesis monooxygenase n=1 Tax=Robertmurraya kyonggiensis TaxID=1037680 RepID=A0A4U1CYA3_9BACI|nr:antibiotic biosynthesis monooxygenase [Robertmurraya kyonggiensis]TKC13862.1 antibiotic biosynthesis monooxygenase [Robertmurraya kyonggiensis]